jgi:hypothetical protein
LFLFIIFRAETFAIEISKYKNNPEDFFIHKKGEVITQHDYNKMCNLKNRIEYISNIHNFIRHHDQQQKVTEDEIKFLGIKKNEYSSTDEFKNLDVLKQKGLLKEKKSIQQLPDVPQNLPQRNNNNKKKNKKKNIRRSQKRGRKIIFKQSELNRRC